MSWWPAPEQGAGKGPEQVELCYTSAMTKKDKVVLVSVPVLFRKKSKKLQWFVVCQGEEEREWVLPRTFVRRGESSVRAAIRLMAEDGGMKVRVLEEVGRTGGATKVNGEAVSQRYLYYLAEHQENEEVLAFEETAWLEYKRATQKLSQKRDKQMLKSAREVLKTLDLEDFVH